MPHKHARRSRHDLRDPDEPVLAGCHPTCIATYMMICFKAGFLSEKKLAQCTPWARDHRAGMERRAEGGEGEQAASGDKRW
jgi:hypothetical protein